LLFFSETKAYLPYYDIKAKVITGGILKHTKHLENTVKGPTLGLEVAVEFLPQGKYDWEKYWNYYDDNHTLPVLYGNPYEQDKTESNS
jgi:hypothetical protein